jgi:HEAT repeat protein
VSTKTVSELLTLLKDNDRDVRSSASEELAASALDMTGPEAEAAVPALIDALKDPDAQVRWKATYALGEISVGAAVSALIDALRAPDAQVRRTAVPALAKIGVAAVPALIDALKDQAAEVRSSAAYELGRIGAEAKSASDTRKSFHSIRLQFLPVRENTRAKERGVRRA